MQESEEEAKPSGFWTLTTDVKYNRRSWRDLPGLCLHVRPVDLHQWVACGAKTSSGRRSFSPQFTSLHVFLLSDTEATERQMG